jgi:ABC-2 type transport system permease protein
MLPIIFLVPIIQLCVLVFAATFEMKNTNLFVVDRDLSTHTRQLTGKFDGSPFFTVKQVAFSMEEAEEALKRDEVDVILHFRKGFGRNLEKEGKGEVQMVVNAIDASAAGLFSAYVRNVIGDYNRRIQVKSKHLVSGLQKPRQVTSTYSFWYNPELDYIQFMLPGILVLLVTVIGLFLSSMNLVREKEIGTIEQINVTPIKKYQFLMGKLIPFLLIGWFELAIGLLIAVFLFKVPLLGSAALIFAVAGVYLLVILGMGLFISTQTETQQQAMFIAWFFMVIFILMSGLFTPIESMPRWGQIVNWFNPLAYFIKVIRMIMLKGSGFSDIARPFFILLGYGVAMLALAVTRYRKVA